MGSGSGLKGFLDKGVNIQGVQVGCGLGCSARLRSRLRCVEQLTANPPGLCPQDWWEVTSVGSTCGGVMGQICMPHSICVYPRAECQQAWHTPNCMMNDIT